MAGEIGRDGATYWRYGKGQETSFRRYRKLLFGGTGLDRIW